MNRLLGGHTNQTWGGIPELVAGWKPAAWLVLNPSPDWGWASENLPTKFAWRPYIADLDFNAPIDPKAAAGAEDASLWLTATDLHQSDDSTDVGNTYALRVDVNGTEGWIPVYVDKDD